MSFAKKHNKERLFEVETEGLPYLKLEEVYGQYGKNAVYRVDALYINRGGKYDDAPVAVVQCGKDRFMLNMPSHMTGAVEDILSDTDDIADIRKHKISGGTWIDVDNEADSGYTHVVNVDDVDQGEY